MELKFYNRPFRNEYGSWIYDAKNNFCFQFEMEFVENWKKIREQVMFSLNSIEHEPVKELKLSVNPKNPIQILNNNKPFILIRGWEIAGNSNIYKEKHDGNSYVSIPLKRLISKD